jgi:hypothetical protein
MNRRVRAEIEKLCFWTLVAGCVSLCAFAAIWLFAGGHLSARMLVSTAMCAMFTYRLWVSRKQHRSPDSNEAVKPKVTVGRFLELCYIAVLVSAPIVAFFLLCVRASFSESRLPG